MEVLHPPPHPRPPRPLSLLRQGVRGPRHPSRSTPAGPGAYHRRQIRRPRLRARSSRQRGRRSCEFSRGPGPCRLHHVRCKKKVGFRPPISSAGMVTSGSNASFPYHPPLSVVSHPPLGFFVPPCTASSTALGRPSPAGPLGGLGAFFSLRR